MNSIKPAYQKKIQEITRTISQIKPEKIILFGSAAFGEMKRDSDIDLCVIKKGKNRLLIKQRITDLLWKADYDWQPELDIHVYPPAVYQDWLSRGDPFIEEIEKGKVLYEK